VGRKSWHAPAGELLEALAAALNACDEAGIAVRLRHGIVFTSAGYVLPLGNGGWAARTLNYSEFSPLDGDEGAG
jgi:hypothetical protein